MFLFNIIVSTDTKASFVVKQMYDIVMVCDYYSSTHPPRK